MSVRKVVVANDQLATENITGVFVMFCCYKLQPIVTFL